MLRLYLTNESYPELRGVRRGLPRSRTWWRAIAHATRHAGIRVFAVTQVLIVVGFAAADRAVLLLVDEPVAGMNPTETAMVTGHLRRLRDEWNMTVILVEHDMRTVMETCDYISVLNFGEKLMEGDPGQVSRDRRVIEAYLGSEDIDL